MWHSAKHLDLLCQALEDVEAGRCKRLIVCMPPRHGKSELISKSFPSWCIGKNPDREIILASYGAELAEGFSRLNREKLREFGQDIFGIRISRESAAVGRWGIEGHRGGMFAVGVQGPITGRGGHIVIIDDPGKGAQEAAPATYRQHTIEWYQTVLRTRLYPDAAIIIVMTRWHKEDLVGWLLAQEAVGGEQWRVLTMPAIAEKNDPLRRNPGEALWPAWFDTKALADIKATMTPYQWLALYQQRPTDPQGALFKHEYFRTYQTTTVSGQPAYQLNGRNYLRRNLTIFQTVDPAASLKSSADWFVIATWGITPDNNLLLLDVYRARVESPDHLARLLQAYETWRPVAVGIEAAGLGKSTYQTAKRSRLPIIPLQPDTDKYTRALPMAILYQSGKVYHPAGSPWLHTWESELLEFPTGEHDDQVDTASYAGILYPTLGRRSGRCPADCLL